MTKRGVDVSLERIQCKSRSTGSADRYEMDLPVYHTPCKTKQPVVATTAHSSKTAKYRNVEFDFDAVVYQTPKKATTPSVTKKQKVPASEPIKRTLFTPITTLDATPETARRIAPPCRKILWTDKNGEIKYAQGGLTPTSVKKPKIALTPKEKLRSAAATSAGAVAGMVVLGPVGLALGTGLVATGAAGFLRGKRKWKRQQEDNVKQLVAHAPPCQNPPCRAFPSLED